MSDLVELIEKAGIIGAGGAGFPTHVKLSSQAEYVIVNGAECEPLIRVDQQLMARYAEEMLSTLEKVRNEIDAQKGIIAVKKKYHEAVFNLTEKLKAYKNIEIFLMDDFYPAGDEQVAVYEVLNRIVPEGGIPIEVKAVVLNAETLLNIYHSLSGKPVTEKYLTVAGAVRNPVTLRVPVGTAVSALIEAAGGAVTEDYEIIGGGPMMGKIHEGNPEYEYVKKNSKGFIVIPKDHPLAAAKRKSIDAMLREAQIACCQCSMCTEVCPRNLLSHRIHPHKLMRIAGYNSVCDNNASVLEAFLCCECGLCEQACVMGLQPWKMNQMIKNKMISAGIKNPYHDQPENVSVFRKYRKFPAKRLIQRLGLEKYNVAAPLDESIKIMPNEVKIDLKPHIGVKAEAVVSENEEVVCGQLIGRIPEGKMGAAVHASLSGIVTSVEEDKITILSKSGRVRNETIDRND